MPVVPVAICVPSAGVRVVRCPRHVLRADSRASARAALTGGPVTCAQVLLDARHVLFSLATKASRLSPASAREMLVRARDKVLLERAAEIALDFWRGARPAADTETSDDKFNAAKLRSAVRPNR